MKKIMVGLGLVFATAWGSQAALIAEYDMSATVEHPSRHLPSVEEEHVTASRLTTNAVTMLYSSAWSTDSISLKANVVSTNLADALANDTYMTFTITADTGYTLDLDSLDFGAYPGGGTPRAFAVYSSVGGFTEGSELLSVSYNAAATGVNSYSIDLSSLSGYDNLSTVEFRYYVQVENTGRSINLSNFSVTGTNTFTAISIVEYDMSSTPEHPSRYLPSLIITNVASSRLTTNATTMGYSSAWSTDSIALSGNVVTTNLADALAKDTYMTFTITADSGYTFSPGSLNFGAYPGGSSARSFAVYSSIGGFTAGSELLSGSYDAAATGITPYSIDLSSLSEYDDLSMVEFRIYVQADVLNRSINISNISVYEDSTIPEPPTPSSPATITIVSGSGFVTISSDDLSQTAKSNVLQSTSNLVAPTWGSIAVSVGVSSTNWVISPLVDDAGFYRIQTYD